MTQQDGKSLSVIVPTWNRSAYVRECLRSLRACGVPDLEIIVADDGSTDDTAAVVAATDPLARHLWWANSGSPAGPRNRGFAESRGRYVAFLDCDDAWLPEAPARAIALLDRYPQVDVLFAEARMGNTSEGYRSWIQTAGQNAFFELPCLRPERDFRILEQVPFFRRMAERNPVFIGAVVMRREAFARAGGFDIALRGAADWELWLRIASEMTFGYLTQPLAIYTRHMDNMSSDLEGMAGEFCLALEKVRDGCGHLARAERAWLRRKLRHWLFAHGYYAFERNDFALARTRFARLLRQCGPECRGLGYWLMSAAPFGLGSRVRRLKQAIARRTTRHARPLSRVG